MMNIFSNKSENVQKVIEIKLFIEKLKLTPTNFTVEIDDDEVKLGGVAEDQETKEKIIIAVGNIEDVEKVQDNMTVNDKSEVAAQFYTVKKGDSLSLISKNFYHDALKYNIIFEANKPMLSHPDNIYPGQTLRIPKIQSKMKLS
jgi:nucleoid-associated protein YgaU